jgi:CRISPR-associated protein Csd2
MNNNYENAINNRYEFVLLYDVENGNPNGDPDAGNLPRLDPETGHGIVTDVCIKRKIRNCVQTLYGGENGFDIYVRQEAILNNQDKLGLEAVKDEKDKEKRSEGFRATMCKTFFDIRAFGAVMTTATKDSSLANVAGQVRGPIQLAFGRSVEPIVPREVTITRVAITTEEKGATASTEMGRKSIVPYGLYRQEGYISANLARTVTGFSNEDLEKFWQALIHMFDDDRSAARGKMALRELIVFKHDSPLGNAPAHKLFDLISVERSAGVEVPRCYKDYVVTIDESAIPLSVSLERKVQ